MDQKPPTRIWKKSFKRAMSCGISHESALLVNENAVNQIPIGSLQAELRLFKVNKTQGIKTKRSLNWFITKVKERIRLTQYMF